MNRLHVLIILALFTARSAWSSTQDDPYAPYTRLKNFSEIEAIAKPNIDYAVSAHFKMGAPFLFYAIHGGSIEPGTSELLETLIELSPESSYYEFKALHPSSDFDSGSWTDPWLHLTSHRYDEAVLLKNAPMHETCVSLHGFYSQTTEVCLGGQNTELVQKLLTALSPVFKTCISCCGKFVGLHPKNPVNLCQKQGVQIEMNQDLRQRLIDQKKLRDRLGGLILESVHH